MTEGKTETKPTVPVPAAQLTEAQIATRRKRSIALGLLLTALVVIFYVLTVVKMGPALFVREI